MFNEVRKNDRQSLIVLLTFLIFTLGIFFLATLLFSYINTPPDYTIYNEMFFFVYAIFVIVTFIYLFYFLKSGDKMVLNIVGAKPVTKAEYPHLYHTVEGLAIAAGIPTPKAYVIKDTALNAFATGFKPENSKIVVTTGLLEKMDRQELEGVIAHEMSHILNKDIKIMLYVTGLIGVFTLIGTFFYYMMLTRSSGKDSGKAKMFALVGWLLFSVIGVFFATLFKLALSRKREYMADANGALLTRYPAGLASALKKISKDPDPLVDKANKATAHLFISSPFRRRGLFTGLFSTHPPIQERIRRLEEM
jgi:heat shock protein HtpX